MTSKEILQHIIDNNGNCEPLAASCCDRCPLSRNGERSCLAFVIAEMENQGIYGEGYAKVAQQLLVEMAITEILLGSNDEQD